MHQRGGRLLLVSERESWTHGKEGDKRDERSMVGLWQRDFVELAQVQEVCRRILWCGLLWCEDSKRREASWIREQLRRRNLLVYTPASFVMDDWIVILSALHILIWSFWESSAVHV